MEGRTVSHYRIIERLGGGGMGVVYKALPNHRNEVAREALAWLDRYVGPVQ